MGGVSIPGVEPLYEAIMKGTDGDWEESAGAMTYPDAVASALKAKGVDASKWLKDSLKMSLPEMKKAAAGLGVGDVHFDWDTARSVEGYYRIKGSTEFCIQRAIAFAPYADLIWMETGKPILSQATQFATEVRAAVPHQMLAYNLSPSFKNGVVLSSWTRQGQSSQADSRRLGSWVPALPRRNSQKVIEKVRQPRL